MNHIQRLLLISGTFLPLVISPALAGKAGAYEGELHVTKLRRITHPVYSAVNQFILNDMNPWNRDFTRIFVVEAGHYTDSATGKKGRGYCWGYLDEMMRWTTLAEYERAAKPLPGRWANFSLYWSPFRGGENILYGISRSPKVVARLNVDTGEIVPVVSYDPQDGTDLRKVVALGWSRDNTFLLGFSHDQGYGGGYEIDVKKRTRRRFKNPPPRPPYGAKTREEQMREFRRWPYRGHAHGGMSPSGRWYYAYRWKLKNGKHGPGGVHSLVQQGLFLKDTGRGEAARKYGAGIVSVSWKNSTDRWLLGVDLGQPYKPDRPSVSSYCFFQMLFDPDTSPHFRYNLLLKHESATLWVLGKKKGGEPAPGSKTVSNYHALCKPTLRKDGKQFIFGSTGGKYSLADHKARGVEPWGTIGMYVADVELAQQVRSNRGR